MVRWLRSHEQVGDPGRVHSEGRAARAAVEAAREQVAAFLGTRPRQVVFTSGGTEAVNAATFGARRARRGPVVLAAVEHSSVRDSSERAGDVVIAAVDGRGRVLPESVDEALTACAAQGAPAALVQCQSANHEVATVQPVAEVLDLARRHGALVHVDACAAVGHLPADLDELGADLVSVSAHKFGGPVGVGALVVRRGVRVDPLIVGGEQERARRAGVENVPAIAGFGAAAEALTGDRLAAEADDARRRTDALAAAAGAVPDVALLGDPVERLPHIVCLAVGGVEAEAVLLALDQAGIAAHSGSACSSESLAPSPVLEAMGVDAERSLRLSVGWSTTDDDVGAFAGAFGRVVGELRALRA